MTHITVATSFRHSHEECCLAEDFKSLLVIRDAFDSLMLAVEVLRQHVGSKAAKEMLAELEVGLGDLRHDVSLPWVVDQAREAFNEVPTAVVKLPTVPK